MKRISGWGLASLLLLIGGYGFLEYNLRLYDHDRPMLLPSWTAVHQVGAVVGFAAVVCGALAVRRQSVLWLLIVLPATWMTLVCFLNDL